MPAIPSRPYLPAMLGYLRQTRAQGELVLEQNDGTRRFYLEDGELRYLRSDAVGEQFGNYLIRQGVLDYGALKDLLKEEGAKVGDKVVQWGLLSEDQRDAHLRELFANILLHAVEHPVLVMAWNPGSLQGTVAGDLPFRLDHRRVIWDVFRQMQTLESLVEAFERETAWRWSAQDSLLDALADLTLTPQLAFAISQLGREPVSFDTLASVTGLDPGEAARLAASLWSLGGLDLVGEGLAAFLGEAPPRPAEKPLEEPIYLDVPAEGAPAAGPPPPPPAPEAPRAQEAPPPPPVEVEQASPQVKARALFRQAESLNTQGRTSEAVRALEQAIKLDPDSPRSYDCWMLLGDLRQGNPAWSTRAVEAYQLAARVQPRNGEPWIRMGHLYQRKGFAANATGCFRKALELDPSLHTPDMILEDPTAAPKEGLIGRIRGLLGGERK